MSATDAATIAQELDIAPADLVNLESHTCYVRLAYFGQQQPTFSLHLHLPRLLSEEQVALLRDLCQRRYCRPAADVEQLLIEALGRAITASQQRQQEEKSKTTTQTTGEPQESASREGSKQGTQFGKTKSKRKKGQVTSFDQHPEEAPSDEQEILNAGDAEQEEMGE